MGGVLVGFAVLGAGAVALEKISESCWIASICLSPIGAIGDDGEGFRMAQHRSMAARMAALAEESAGIAP